jgi:hypothetical protein
MEKMQLFGLFSKFKSWMTYVEDAKCPLASRTEEIVDQVKELGLENRRIAICEVVNMLGNFFWVGSDYFERI